jgi:hypothetical protein
VLPPSNISSEIAAVNAAKHLIFSFSLPPFWMHDIRKTKKIRERLQFGGGKFNGGRALLYRLIFVDVVN